MAGVEVAGAGPRDRSGRADHLGTGLAHRARALAAGRYAAVRAHPISALVVVVAWSVLCTYEAFELTVGPVGYWGDTQAYAAVARAPFPSVALLAGARPPLVPLLMKLAASPLSFGIVETALSLAAWTFLAACVGGLVPAGWRRATAICAVLGFAGCWPVAEWNWNVLSESVALSATAVVAAGALLWAGGRPRTGAALVVLAAAVLAADRDQEMLVIGLGAVVLVASWAIGARGPDGRRERRARRVNLVTAVALACVCALAATGAYSSHRNVVNVEDVFDVRVFPVPARVAWFEAHGMPEAPAIDRLARATRATAGDAKVVVVDTHAAAFRPLARWFAARGEATYLEFLATHPWYVLTAPLASPPLTFNNADGNLAFYGSMVAPGHPNEPLPGLPHLFFPAWPVVLLVGLAEVVVVVRARRTGRDLPDRGALALCAALAALGVVSMLVAWHGDGMEVARHILEGDVAARLCVLVAAVVLLLGGGRRGHARHGSRGTGRAGPVRRSLAR